MCKATKTTKTTRKSSSNFQRGSGCFKCRVCNKKTRSTGRGDHENVRLCVDCYDYASWENTHSDDGHDYDAASRAQGLADGCPICAELGPLSPEVAPAEVAAEYQAAAKEDFLAVIDAGSCDGLLGPNAKEDFLALLDERNELICDGLDIASLLQTALGYLGRRSCRDDENVAQAVDQLAQAVRITQKLTQ